MLPAAGVRLRVEKRTVDLWWKGEVPPEVREEIVDIGFVLLAQNASLLTS